MAEEDDEHIYMKIIEFTTNNNANVPSTSITSATRVSNRPQRKRFGSKNFKVTRASSNQLRETITMDLRAEHKLVLSFLPDDKLVIMFKHMEKYVVYRKSDSAVAVLKKPEFKKSNSTIMFDGDKMGAILHNVQMVIMYAVAKTEFYDSKSGMQFNTFDLILVLAKCRGVYLGITAENRVGFFPPEKVVVITRPRACLFPGMTLKVEASISLEARSYEFLSVRQSEVHTITKGKTNLFDWCTPFERRKVPLHVFRECEVSKPAEAPPPLPASRRQSREELKPSEAPPPIPVPRRQSRENLKQTDALPPLPPRKWSGKGIGKDYNTTASKNDKIHEDVADDFQPYTPDPMNISRRLSRISITSTTSDSQTGIEASELFDKIPENDERLYAVYGRTEDLTEKKMKEREYLLQKLLPYREVVFSEGLRDIVSEYVDDDVLHDLCERIKISKNRLRDIHDQKETIYEKTYVLLGIWSQKFGSDAKVGFLLDALVEVNPEDLNLILEFTLRHLEDAKIKDSGSYDKIPDRDDLYALPKNAKDKQVKVFMNNLRWFREVEVNDEMRQIVSQYVDDDVWHDLGESLEIPKNMRRQIEKNRDDIYEKTFDLLNQWHRKFGSDATLGFLLDALESANPDDLYLILKDLSKELVTSGQGAPCSNYESVW